MPADEKAIAHRALPMLEEEWRTYLALEQAGPRPGPRDALTAPPWGNGDIPQGWLPPTSGLPLPLATLLGTRRSAALLFHPLNVAALRQVLSLALARPEQGAPHRPYPTSGGCDELGVLVAARRVEGLNEGAYWATANEGRTLSYAARLDQNYLAFERRACPFLELPPGETPAALLLIMADWHRLSSRYTNCVLASALWDCGALLQTLHLAATAVEVNACICACVQPRLIEAWLDLDCRNVGQVGLIALGGRADQVL